MVVAVPTGLAAGALIGGWICFTTLRFYGMGQSHNDIFTLFVAQVLGALLGSVSLPIVVLRVTRQTGPAEPDARANELHCQ